MLIKQLDLAGALAICLLCKLKCLIPNHTSPSQQGNLSAILDVVVESLECRLPVRKVEFDSRLSEACDLYNVYLYLHSLALCITRIGRGVDRALSG